jgi:ABC-2 type transport system ATP-binding protein
VPNSSTPALVIDGLIKDVGPLADHDGRMKRIVAGISMNAHRGQVTALLGANGAGKTTTLECAQGLQKRDGGTITLLGEDPDQATAALRARVGVMLQDGGLPPAARPVALLRHVAGMYRNPRSVDDLVERLGISAFASTSIRRLSGGQRQRVALAASLVGNPEVLFLDEPSAGLDPQSRRTVFDLIRELRDAGLAIVLTTHLLDDAQKLADYVYIVDAGRTVASGTVPELLRQATTAEAQRTLVFEAIPRLRPDVALRAEIAVEETRPGSYAITGPLTPADLAALAGWWSAQGIMPTSVHLASRSLEDVFLALSGSEQP